MLDAPRTLQNADMRSYWVYMLRCSDGSYYIGITNDPARRTTEHMLGTDPKSYTYRRRPLERVYASEFYDVHEAIAWEKHIKRWSRKKKEALIRGEYELLPALSRRRAQFKKKIPS